MEMLVSACMAEEEHEMCQACVRLRRKKMATGLAQQFGWGLKPNTLNTLAWII